MWRTNVGAPLVLTAPAAVAARGGRRGPLAQLGRGGAALRDLGPVRRPKAALDHLALTFGAETGLTAYAVDPGDMRTAMHQDAFPGEDISDRPLPETVVPRLLALLERGRRRRTGPHRAEVAR